MTFFKRLLILLAVTICSLGMVRYNLYLNHIYYYTHSPYTDKAKTPFVVIDALDTQVPPLESYDGDFYYRIEGLHNIEYKTDDTSIWLSGGSRYSIRYYEGHTKRYYVISDDFTIKHASLSDEEKTREPLSPTPEDSEKIKADIHFLVQPTLDKIQPPLFNFQWLFDDLYQKGKLRTRNNHW